MATKKKAAYISPWIARQIGGKQVVLDEKIGWVLALANKGTVPYPASLALVSGAHIGTISQSLIGEARAYLARISKSSGKSASEIAQEIGAQLAGKVVAVPDFRTFGKLSYWHFAADIPDAIRLSIALLCTSHAATALCRCTYRKCENFFFSKREHEAGRVRREYCTELHREEENRIRAKERIRAFRAARKRSRMARKHK